MFSIPIHSRISLKKVQKVIFFLPISSVTFPAFILAQMDMSHPRATEVNKILSVLYYSIISINLVYFFYNVYITNLYCDNLSPAFVSVPRCRHSHTVSSSRLLIEVSASRAWLDASFSPKQNCSRVRPDYKSWSEEHANAWWMVFEVALVLAVRFQCRNVLPRRHWLSINDQPAVCDGVSKVQTNHQLGILCVKVKKRKTQVQLRAHSLRVRRADVL